MAATLGPDLAAPGLHGNRRERLTVPRFLLGRRARRNQWTGRHLQRDDTVVDAAVCDGGASRGTTDACPRRGSRLGIPRCADGAGAMALGRGRATGRTVRLPRRRCLLWRRLRVDATVP